MSSGRESGDRQRWAELKSLFNAAVERPREDWPDVVGSLRRRDPDLADQLQRLLDGHEESLIRVRPPRPDHLEPGATLGPYVITGLIGEGGMGQVYRAKDGRLGRDVAIKVLPPDLAHDSGRRARMEREARAMGMIDHPNIVMVHDIGDHRGSPFIVSELLEGRTLRERVAAGGSDNRLAPNVAVEIVASVADALGAAHRRGIVHRDIKPENVFLTLDGRVKVLDFGIAKLVAGEAPGDGTAFGILIGTLGYMAPEQFRGDAVGAPADVYACGVVLYELLRGERPFAGRAQPALIAAILNERPAPVPGLSAQLATLLARCLDKDPDARFAHGAELASALRGLTAFDAAADDPAREAPTLRLQDVPPAPAGEAGIPAARRAGLVAAVIVLVGGVAAAGWLWYQPRDDRLPEPSRTTAEPAMVVPAPSASRPEPEPDARRPEVPTPSPSREARSEAPAPAPGQGRTGDTAPEPRASAAPAAPLPQPPAPASAPAPVAASLDGIWRLTERVAEDAHAIECTAEGALQVKTGDGVLDGNLRLKQECKDSKRTDSTEAVAALMAGTLAGDTVSFVARTRENGLATTCRYTGRVVGSSRGTMIGEVECEAREAGRSSVLALRGTWRADRTAP